MQQEPTEKDIYERFFYKQPKIRIPQEVEALEAIKKSHILNKADIESAKRDLDALKAQTRTDSYATLVEKRMQKLQGRMEKAKQKAASSKPVAELKNDSRVKNIIGVGPLDFFDQASKVIDTFELGYNDAPNVIVGGQDRQLYPIIQSKLLNDRGTAQLTLKGVLKKLGMTYKSMTAQQRVAYAVLRAYNRFARAYNQFVRFQKNPELRQYEATKKVVGKSYAKDPYNAKVRSAIAAINKGKFYDTADEIYAQQIAKAQNSLKLRKNMQNLMYLTPENLQAAAYYNQGVIRPPQQFPVMQGEQSLVFEEFKGPSESQQQQAENIQDLLLRMEQQESAYQSFVEGEEEEVSGGKGEKTKVSTTKVKKAIGKQQPTGKAKAKGSK